MTKYLYRYRSLNNPFIFQELENLEIYFAKPDELNDQMEDYMNIFWQGDEIAFQGLFKHYLYVLSSVYYDVHFRNRKKKIDPNYLPVFLASDVSDKPEMKTTFKSIYYEFFNCLDIYNIPIKLAESNKKYSIDEILLILTTLHKFAYLVIDAEFKKFDKNIDPFKDSEYKEIYESLKYCNEYSNLIDIINKSEKKEILNLIYKLELEQEQIRKYLNKEHEDKDTYNIDLISFEFPKVYIKNIKKVLYNQFCAACFTNSFQNEPMWSNYANSENGICLIYKTKEINGKKCLTLNSACGDNKSNKTYKAFCEQKIYEVKYTNEYPEINFFASLGGLPKKIIEDFWLCNFDRTKFSNCLKHYEDHAKWYYEYHKKAEDYICIKSKNWEYEQEQRIILKDLIYPAYEKEENRKANYKIEDLQGLIFGRKVSLEDKRKIIKIMLNHCNDKKIFNFYDLYYSTITNQLELKPCSEYLLY